MTHSHDDPDQVIGEMMCRITTRSWVVLYIDGDGHLNALGASAMELQTPRMMAALLRHYATRLERENTDFEHYTGNRDN